MVFNEEKLQEEHRCIAARGNTTIWSIKMMVLPSKIARSPGENWWENVKIGFNAIYVTNISTQSAMTRNISADDDFICSIYIGS